MALPQPASGTHRNLKPGCTPGVRTVQTCGLAGVPWVGQRSFGPKGLSAPQSYTHWSGYPCYLLPHHAPLCHTHTHTHTHALPHLLCSITVLSSQHPTSQNLTKKSEETGSYNVPKNTYVQGSQTRQNTFACLSSALKSPDTRGKVFLPPPRRRPPLALITDQRSCGFNPGPQGWVSW